MAIDPTRVPRFGHGSRVPGWDEAADLSKDPAGVPDPATTEVPGQLRAAIEAHMAKYPDRRSAAIPALHEVQARYGWCSPEGIEQALDGLPEGPYITTNRKYALPPRHELATSMEALIHHFKLVTEGFRVPPGEAYVAIESPRGELGCYVLADGSSKPARLHMRDPSFVNLQSLPDMAKDSLIADFIACVAMLDPILGGVDR